MFVNLESFSIFYFTCLVLVILGIVFEDQLIALEKKHEAKHTKKKTTIKEVHRNEDTRTAKSA